MRDPLILDFGAGLLAVRAEPQVVSPNVLEAEELVGHEFRDEADRQVAVIPDFIANCGMARAFAFASTGRMRSTGMSWSCGPS